MTPRQGQFQMTMRRTLQIAIIVAATLLVVAPLLHRVTDEALSHCTACTAYHAVDADVDSLSAPEQSNALVVIAATVDDHDFISSASSRAPPQLFG